MKKQHQQLSLEDVNKFFEEIKNEELKNTCKLLLEGNKEKEEKALELQEIKNIKGI